MRAQPIRFALFVLAEKLGVIDPDALGDAIPTALVHQWVAFYQLRAELEKSAVKSGK